MSDDYSSNGPYERLEASDVAAKRRRIRLLGLINISLCIVLTLVAVVLLGTLIPRIWYHHRLWPYSDSPCSGPSSYCPIVLISMDGFRHDYLELVRARYGPGALPNFARFQQGGVRAMRSINAYPTITLPNHHTLVTGINPESHGVVANNVRDTKFPNTVFQMNNQTSLNEAPWVKDWPEPIWVTLQRTGRLAGSLLWPLTDGPVQGDLPFMQVSQFTLVNQPMARYAYTKRVSDLLWWLHNPRFRLDLILAYFDEPDETGHAFGPESEEVAQRVVELDTVLGLLMDGLAKEGLQDQVDIILTADHGMAATNKSRVIPLDQYVDPNWYSYTQLSTMGFLYPSPGKLEDVYQKLHGANEHMRVYRSKDVPADLHFSISSSRMPPLVVIPDDGWYLVHREGTIPSAGDHGYPMNFTDMNPFFLAHGPSFLINKTIPEVHAVDIYSLLTGLLGLPAQPNNGSMARIAHALLKPDVAETVLHTPVWFPRWWAWFMLQLHMVWIFIGVALWAVLLGMVLSLFYAQRRHIRMLAIYDTTWNGVTA